jgi:hypothetical protein
MRNSPLFYHRSRCEHSSETDPGPERRARCQHERLMRTGTLPLVGVLPPRLLAALTGASLRSAQRWRGGTIPRPATAARLRETDAILDLLGRGSSAVARRAWLEAPNPALGGDRPIDRIARGDLESVRGAATGYGVGDFV